MIVMEHFLYDDVGGKCNVCGLDMLDSNISRRIILIVIKYIFFY